MSGLRRVFRSSRAQALVELTLTLPLLIILGLGVIEFSNMVNAYLVLTHLTREAANLVSREPGKKGTLTWADSINADLDTVINSASPVLNTTGTGPTGPSQWRVIYSMIEYTGSACPGDPLPSGESDNYRIRRSNSGWDGSVDWEDGELSEPSKIGENGDCASAKLPEVKQLSTKGLTLHVVEVFYDYAPSKLTPVQNFIGTFVPSIFYTRTVFMDVTGG